MSKSIVLCLLAFSSLITPVFAAPYEISLAILGKYGTSGFGAGAEAFLPIGSGGRLGITAGASWLAMESFTSNLAGSGIAGNIAYPLFSGDLGMRYYFLPAFFSDAALHAGYVPTIERRWTEGGIAQNSSVNAGIFNFWPSVSLGAEFFFTRIAATLDLFAADNISVSGTLSFSYGFSAASFKSLEKERFVSVTSSNLAPESNLPSKDLVAVKPADPVESLTAPDGFSPVFGSNTIAVIIGNRNYQNDMPRADFALNDAAAFSNYAVKTFGIPPQNIIFKSDATFGNLTALFGSDDNFKGQLYRRLVIGKYNLIVFYSGHGAPEIKSGKGYLVPVDADIIGIDKTGYPIDTLFANLASIRAAGNIGSAMLIFDSCFSGDSGGGKLIGDISPVALKIENPMFDQADTLMLFSSSGNEVSSWYREKSHGMFSFFLMTGLQGEADFDQDRKITVRELNRYLGEKVPAWAMHQTGQEQHPQIRTKNPDMVLVNL